MTSTDYQRRTGISVYLYGEIYRTDPTDKKLKLGPVRSVSMERSTYRTDRKKFKFGRSVRSGPALAGLRPDRKFRSGSLCYDPPVESAILLNGRPFAGLVVFFMFY